MNDYGFNRKFGRGFANAFFGATEIPDTLCKVDDRLGGTAAASYGVFKAVNRFVFRFGAGIYEMALAPFPTYKGSYRPFYKSDIPWIHGGYQEFPPDLGLETRYMYNRELTPY